MGLRGITAVIACAFFVADVNAGIIGSALRHWTFDGTLVDEIGNVGGTGAGGWDNAYRRDRFGNANSALDLSSERDAVVTDISNDLPLLTDYTISLWFQMDRHNYPIGRSFLFDTRDELGNEYASLAAFVDNTPNDQGVNSGTNPASAWLGTYAGDKQKRELTNANNQLWHNLIFSFAGNTQDIYFNGIAIDGIPVFTSDSLSEGSDFNQGFVFGDIRMNIGGGGFNFQGAIDDFVLWGNALTRDEVQEYYAASVPTPGSLVLLLAGLGLILIRR